MGALLSAVVGAVVGAVVVVGGVTVYQSATITDTQKVNASSVGYADE